jgi:hypothetical protein
MDGRHKGGHDEVGGWEKFCDIADVLSIPADDESEAAKDIHG